MNATRPAPLAVPCGFCAATDSNDHSHECQTSRFDDELCNCADCVEVEEWRAIVRQSETDGTLDELSESWYDTDAEYRSGFYGSDELLARKLAVLRGAWRRADARIVVPAPDAPLVDDLPF